MKGIKGNLFLGCAIVASMVLAFSACNNGKEGAAEEQTESNPVKLTKVEGEQLTYVLPSPQFDGTVSVEQALVNRRSQRNYIDRPVSPEQLSQILWAAYGVTEPLPGRAAQRGGLRTAPSAGGLYPFEIYVIIGGVNDMESGVYRYISEKHTLVRTIAGDLREEVSLAALNQRHIKDAPVTVFYSAVYSRMTQKYGDRGRERYVCIDLGHSAQNIYLQAGALGLGTCAVGAFHDERIARLLQLPEEEEPLYLMPVGYFPKQRR